MPTPAGRYIDLSFVQKFWGIKPVDAWADADGDGVRGPEDEAIIQEAIEDAEADIDSALAEAYTVPFVEPIPRLVRTLSRLRAGVYLYGRRGFREGSDAAGQMRAWWELTERILEDLRLGRRQIPQLSRRRAVGFRRLKRSVNSVNPR